IGSLGMFGIVIGSIATNNRNKVDSTQTMLASSILEQINSVLIGSASSQLVDCAGNTWTINTTVPPSGYAGADLTLSGSTIDFTPASPPAGYYMDYVVSTPCSSSGIVQGTYDVRWHLDLVGGTSLPTKTYLLTVAAKLKNHGEGNLYFSAPLTLRVMSGN